MASTTHAAKDRDDAAADDGRPSSSTSSALPIRADWSAPTVPAHTSNALWHLESRLMQVQQEKEDNDTASINGRGKGDDTTTIDDLLATTEFLYGNKLLSNALALVDSCQSLITQVVAPSGRIAYLFRGSKGDETYLCLCSNTSSKSFSTTASYVGSVHYCSCRSYFESAHKVSVGMTAASGESTTMLMSPVKWQKGNTYQQIQSYPNHASSVVSSGPPLCKHLLALKLLPYLEGEYSSILSPSINSRSSTNTPGRSSCATSTTKSFCPQQTTVTENEFATLLLNHVGMPLG